MTHLLLLFILLKMKAKLPAQCPSCESLLIVSQLQCEHCGTTAQGNYPLPMFLKLSPKKQEFILQFILARGSLKEMAAKLGISYPIVRNQLDYMIQHIKDLNISTL